MLLCITIKYVNYYLFCHFFITLTIYYFINHYGLLFMIPSDLTNKLCTCSIAAESLLRNLGRKNLKGTATAQVTLRHQLKVPCVYSLILILDRLILAAIERNTIIGQVLFKKIGITQSQMILIFSFCKY